MRRWASRGGVARLGVLADPGFRRFWAAQTVSLFGTQVTELGLPLTAVLLLHATPTEMGLLTAIGFVPFLLVGLPAGVWVDRFSRRAILIAADVASATAVALVPLSAAGGVLAMPWLYLAQLVLGFTEVVARVAQQSFVPLLVGRSRLIEANARLEASSSVAAIAGPGLGGVLVQAVTAPIALVVDALSYAASAVLLRSTEAREPRGTRAERSTVRAEIREGVALVLRTPPLRALTAGGAVHNLFSRMIDALLVLYAVDVLGLSPAVLGLAVAAAGPGALLGTAVVGGLNSRLGIGPALAWLQVLTGVARLLIPLAAAVPDAGAPILAASNFLLGLASTAYNISQVSLRVAITPDHLHGRVNATIRFLTWAVTPFGALSGGLLASTVLGLTLTIALAAFGVVLAAVPLRSDGLRVVRQIPTAPATS